MRNVSIIDLHKSRKAAIVVSVGDSANLRPHCLKFVTVAGSHNLHQKAEITVRLSDALYQIWQRSGGMLVDMVEKSNQTFLITGANARLDNLFFMPEEWGLLSVQFNFLTRAIPLQADYKFHVVQTYCDMDEVIGGELYHVITPYRVPFYAHAEDVYAFQDEPITLTAADIGEDAVYNWYDMEGHLVYEGMEFDFTATEQTTYKLEVIAEADGYKDYAEVMVKIVPGKIEELYPNPASNFVTVTCVYNNVSDVRIVVSNYFGLTYGEFPLSDGDYSVSFNTINYPIGTYMVKLICDGQVADVKTFVKH
jgi:hypothetical protein